MVCLSLLVERMERTERKVRRCAGLICCFSWLGVLLCTASSPELKVKECVLLEHANITCYWTPVGPETTSYNLSVNMTYCENDANYKTMGWCGGTKPHCSVDIGSVSHCFCVDVLASSSSGSMRSPRLCLIGIKNVKMYTPEIERLDPMPGKAHCLSLKWMEKMSEHVLSERDHRVLEIEYRTLHQNKSWRESTMLHNWQIELCGLHPGTKHYVKVRAQDKRATQHWSSWSNEVEATTAEAAPAAAPELWRHIEPVDRSGLRRITLLWKLLQWPDTNGIILSYAASCWSEVSSDWSHPDCGDLSSVNTSCVLSISTNPYTCNLTVTNSAGSSPPAHIYIPGVKDPVLPPPLSLTVTPVDDQKLKVEWTFLMDQKEVTFVVQWFAIPRNTVSDFHWQHLSGSFRSVIITEDVRPEVPYNVSVQTISKTSNGAPRSAVAFTRQGAPSVGPKLEVLHTEINSVALKWDPVPLEKLHGFIQNYTIFYKSNGKIKSRLLGGNVDQYPLSGLSPGEYTICIRAHTTAGAADGPWVTVSIGNDNIPVMVIMLCAAGSLLILIIFLILFERIQRRLCPSVPDPSKSSLSTWPPASQNQQKLTVLDFKPSPSLLELINIGRMTSHQELSPGWPFTYHTVPLKSVSNDSKSHKVFPKQVSAKTDNHEAEKMLREQNAKEATEDPITDLSYRNTDMTKPQNFHQTHVSSSCPAVPESCLEMDGFDLMSRVGPTHTSSCHPPVPESSLKMDAVDFISMLELRFHTQVSSSRPKVPESCLRVDSFDLLYKNNFLSQIESCGYTHVSTSYLPVPDAGTGAEDSTTLAHKMNFLPELDTCCYAHLSTSYLPVPQTDYSDFVMKTEDTNLCQHNLKSKAKPCYYTHVSCSYLPVPLSDGVFRKDAGDPTRLPYKNNIITKAESHYQKLCLSSPMCSETKTEDCYRTLGLEERPLLSCPLQKSST